MKLDAKVTAALQEIEVTRGVPREHIIEALGEAIKAAYERKHGPTPNLEIEVDMASSTIDVYLSKRVVEKPENPVLEISLEEAKSYDESAEIGDYLLIETEMGDLGYWGVNAAKNMVKNLIRQAEKDRIQNEFKTKVFDLISCTVQYEERRDVYLETPNKVEGVIPGKERIPDEPARPGQRIKCMLVEVRSGKKSGPLLVFSRTHPDLIRRLMENEIPEVREGSIEIMAIARDPGFRAKVAVKSNLPELDPVGTCIGSRGVRVTAISHELNEEKIDLVPWRADSFEFIAEALSPAKVLSVEIFENEKRALVVVPDDQISLAIGKSWRNVKLASRLTKYFLEVKSVSEIEAEEGGQPEGKGGEELDAEAVGEGHK
jgi:N utilization substance protein A